MSDSRDTSSQVESADARTNGNGTPDAGALDAAARERAATWLERMVQTLLAVVLGQAIFRNDRLLTEPFNYRDVTALMALGTVMYLALSSWMALAQLLSEVPYSVRSKYGALRLYADAAAIFIYAYLLLTLYAPERCVATTSCGLAIAHFYSYPAVFVCYALASWARGRQETEQLALGHLRRLGSKRPRPSRAILAGVLLLISAVAFNIVIFAVTGTPLRWIERGLIVWIAFVVVTYRLSWYRAISRL